VSTSYPWATKGPGAAVSQTGSDGLGRSLRLTDKRAASVAQSNKHSPPAPPARWLMQDFFCFEKLAHQNPERISESGCRPPRGSGASGTAEQDKDVTNIPGEGRSPRSAREPRRFLRFSDRLPRERRCRRCRARERARLCSCASIRKAGQTGPRRATTRPVFFVRGRAQNVSGLIHTQKAPFHAKMRSPRRMWDRLGRVAGEPTHQVDTLVDVDRGLAQS